MKFAVISCCLLAGLAAAREITEKDVPELGRIRALLKTLKDNPQGLKSKALRSKRSAPVEPESEAAVTCSQSQVTGCLKTFLAPFGVSALPANPNTLVNALFKYYQANGAPGYVSVCTQLAGLETCLGPAQWSACFTPVNMVQNLGLSYGASLTYVSIMNSLPYACSTAVSPILNNWACASGVVQSQATNLTACVNAMIQRTNTPSYACIGYEIFLTCYALPFHLACGETVAYSVCQGLRRGLIVAQPQCVGLTCAYVSH